jgi:hypothetical protein
MNLIVDICSHTSNRCVGLAQAQLRLGDRDAGGKSSNWFPASAECAEMVSDTPTSRRYPLVIEFQLQHTVTHGLVASGSHDAARYRSDRAPRKTAGSGFRSSKTFEAGRPSTYEKSIQQEILRVYHYTQFILQRAESSNKPSALKSHVFQYCSYHSPHQSNPCAGRRPDSAGRGQEVWVL